MINYVFAVLVATPWFFLMIKLVPIKNFTVSAKGKYENKNILAMFRSWGGFGSFRMYTTYLYFTDDEFHLHNAREIFKEDFIMKIFAKNKYKEFINKYGLKDMGDYS